MVIKTINSDVYRPTSHFIAFSVNTEGIIGSNFSQYIARNYWPELFYRGNNNLGEVLSKKVGDITFFALVCYSMKNGFSNDQQDIIKMCFDKIPVYDETIDAVEISLGMYGHSLRAVENEIIYGMQLSNKSINLYTKYSFNEIKSICNEMSLKYDDKKKVLNFCESDYINIPKDFHINI